MGRWRPPPPKSSPYITADGYAAMQQELKDAWLRRRDVVCALSEAAAEGDRSENAEYIYRKKELAGIDRRIRYLQKRLPSLTVVTDQPAGDAVFFGAIVDVIDEQGECFRYRIVGPDETDAKRSAISIDSPLARALLGKRVGDDAHVDAGQSPRSLSIEKITYRSEPE